MDDALSNLVEKDRVLEVVNRLFVETDRRDWSAVRDCLAPSVEFDMTSAAGGEPTRLTPAQIAGAWETGLSPIESVLKFLDGDVELEKDV